MIGLQCREGKGRSVHGSLEKGNEMSGWECRVGKGRCVEGSVEKVKCEV